MNQADRIYVVGCGAVGLTLAAYLAKKEDVSWRYEPAGMTSPRA